MKTAPKRNSVLVFVVIVFFCAAIQAQNLDIGGVTLLREATTNLNGAGIRVAQPEAAVDTNGDWEVNPANMMQPVNLFTYFTNGGSSSTYPNSLGGDSWHADDVGAIFYGLSDGVATNVAHVDNFEVNYFYNDFIATNLPQNITDAVVNQSYTFGNVTTNTPTPPNELSVSDQQQLDSQYDNYSAQYQTLFISAANNGGSVSPPGTSYNCISVGAYDGASSDGPTLDNGRCKPDINAPVPPSEAETSFSTPLAAGAAAVLMQAGLRGDGGGNTNAAANMTTIKALLLNGAVKPADWTNVAPSPLDFRYGAGVLNVFNSYEQLASGKHGYNFSTNVPTGMPHPPVAMTNSVPVLSGWDFNTNTSSHSDDAVNHYFFNVTNGSRTAVFTLTATLVWNRHQNQTEINNLALFLYNAANSNLVSCSTSVVDNVQHVFIPQLPSGRYDLQVWKAGGSGIVSHNEPYALAWEFFSESLNATRSGTNLILSWPVYPAGFVVESTTNLIPPIFWSTNNVPPSVFTNNQNEVSLNATNSVQFFRLRTPNF